MEDRDKLMQRKQYKKMKGTEVSRIDRGRARLSSPFVFLHILCSLGLFLVLSCALFLLLYPLFAAIESGYFSLTMVFFLISGFKHLLSRQMRDRGEEKESKITMFDLLSGIKEQIP